jgi:hypothetical protein
MLGSATQMRGRLRRRQVAVAATVTLRSYLPNLSSLLSHLKTGIGKVFRDPFLG